MKTEKRAGRCQKPKTKIWHQGGQKILLYSQIVLFDESEKALKPTRSSAMPVDIKSADIKQIWPKISRAYGPGCLRLYPLPREQPGWARAPPPVPNPLRARRRSRSLEASRLRAELAFLPIIGSILVPSRLWPRAPGQGAVNEHIAHAACGLVWAHCPWYNQPCCRTE